MQHDGEVEVALAKWTAEPLCPFDVFDLGNNADLGQLRSDDFTALARVGRWGKLERQVQGRLDAGLRKQGLCLLDVERVDAGGIDISWQPFDIVASDG